MEDGKLNEQKEELGDAKEKMHILSVSSQLSDSWCDKHVWKHVFTLVAYYAQKGNCFCRTEAESIMV